uniref:Adenylyl cyclase-associated protein 1-like n=1 Tax=Phallusia mammillata TaxID=59560 RepID=A0A6F9D7R1_9ASCI|nr:adenylyl cyclase-associated protein 1-like [Phallusia mammillata]
MDPQPGVLDLSRADAAPKALFAEINSKGLGITGGLKKVTNDMKTHKNPDLRQHAPVPFKAKQPPTFKPMGKPKAAPKMPPKLVLEGKKWIVEYQENQNNLVIDNTEMKQTIYIYKCTKSALIVKGKINSIVLDSCKKMGVAFESVVSGVEIINSDSIQVQAQGTMPNVSIDKTDGCLVYLSKECLDCQIVSAKSSEMNVARPKGDDSGDFDEYPISEQFRTFWDEKKKTFVSESAEQMG